MKRKIRKLATYFEDDGLKHNIDKSKMVVFRKGGKLSKTGEFFLNGQEIECVNEYVYLGVVFSSSGLFRKAMKARKQRARIAIGKVIDILRRGTTESLTGANKLFESCIMTNLLNCSPVWGLRHT